jgi:hypothetical protein
LNFESRKTELKKKVVKMGKQMATKWDKGPREKEDKKKRKSNDRYPKKEKKGCWGRRGGFEEVKFKLSKPEVSGRPLIRRR